jgi:hypothetical protein
MELTEQLDFCRKCQKREINSAGTLLCSLTHKRPSDDQIGCKDYFRDESEPDTYLDSDYVIEFGEIKGKLDSSIFEKMIIDQNFLNSIIFGLLATIIGAIIWALISFYTGYQIGYMAIGIGALVGFSIRYFGRGFELKFAITGALISLLGCLLGNLFTVIGFASKEYNLGLFQLLSTLSLNMILEVMRETFKFIDLVFYGLAVYEGFRFGAMRFTEKSLWTYTQKFK